MTTRPVRVGILIFDQVEVLDFAGPYEVFSRTRTVPGVASRRSDEGAPFQVFTVAEDRGPLRAVGGLQVIPDHGFDDAPPIDLLVVPGGFGVRSLLESESVRDWVVRVAANADRVTSVCTGALLLARCGLLRSRRATTHWCALDALAALDETIDVRREERVVDDGVVTSAGVSAGLDMAFAVVAAILGNEVAEETAHYLEYRLSP